MVFVVGGLLAAGLVGIAGYEVYKAVQRNQARERIREEQPADGGSLLPQ
ncbi:hypothetical protein [Streptomyces tritici]